MDETVVTSGEQLRQDESVFHRDERQIWYVHASLSFSPRSAVQVEHFYLNLRPWTIIPVTSSSYNPDHSFMPTNSSGKGPTARIAPHMLVTCDPALFKKMNAVRGDWVRSEWYTALRLHPKRDNITSTTDEGLHADLRKRMAPGVGLFVIDMNRSLAYVLVSTRVVKIPA